MRGYLVVCRGDMFFALSAADDMNWESMSKKGASAADGAKDPVQWPGLRDMLVKLYASIRFT